MVTILISITITITIIFIQGPPRLLLTTCLMLLQIPLQRVRGRSGQSNRTVCEMWFDISEVILETLTFKINTSAHWVSFIDSR